MTKIYLKGTHPWQMTSDLSISEVIKNYQRGFAGVYLDPDEKDRFNELSKKTGGYTNLEDAAHHYKWADSFSGKLVIPFVHVVESYPGCWPGPGQARGDCVSHSDKNTKLGTMVCEVIAGKPDEVTGVLERLPDVSQAGIKNGVLSTESVYWYRGHSGHGWYCGASANVSMEKSGCVIRKNYPELGFDLTTYSGSQSERYGRKAPPANITEAFNDHLIRTAARVNTFDAARDILGQGKFIHTCGSEGYEKTRDKWGVSDRRGSWAHAMANIAADDRQEIKDIYGEPLILVLNSWGSYNSGPRDIFDSAKYVPEGKKELWEKIDLVNPQTGNIMIPKGSFWCKWSTWQRREMLAYSGVNGWEAQKIDWGVDLWG